MKHLPILFLLLLSAAAARAQEVLNPPEGDAYELSSTSPATAVNPVAYQWYRNGAPIAGATSADYTVPAAEAYGTRVEFVRKATTEGCTGVAEASSNTVTVTFGEGWPTLTVGAVTWAATNVDARGTLADNPDDYGMFYQWNRNTGVPNSGTVTGWNNNYSGLPATWTVSPLPCPAGWAMPTQADFTALTGSGSTWAAANTKGNAVPGRFYGPNHATCSLSGSMAGCVFLPAAGSRGYSNGALVNQGAFGQYWTSAQYAEPHGYYLSFNSGSAGSITYFLKSSGASVRCVQK